MTDAVTLPPELGGRDPLPPRGEREPIVMSNSSIQVFKSCRRKFWLQYVRRLRPKQEKRSGALALGSRVHRALELFYQDALPPTSAPTSGEEGVARITAIWSQLVADDRLLLEAEGGFTDDFDNEAELGRIMLEGYCQWIEDEGIDSEYEVVGLEDTLEHPFLGGQVRVVGKLDQRIRRKVDGTLLVRDFKTAAQFSDLMKTIEMHEQFLLYQTLEMLLKKEDERVLGSQVVALRKVKRTASSKPPFYAVMEIEHNVFTLRNFYKHLHGVLQDALDMWRDLEDGADHHVVAYPRPTRDCSWICPFAQVCPMFDNGSAVEEAIESQFEVGSPYSYYGESDPLKKEEG